MRILVTDDDPSLRLLCKLTLQKAGYEVVLAEDGLQALEHIRTSAPDLVLLDVSMPNMDGLAVLKQLRSEGVTSVPVVLVSARVGTLDRLHGLEAGAIDYICKPFEPNDLLTIIEDLRLMTEDKRMRYRIDMLERTRLEHVDKPSSSESLDVVEPQQPTVLPGSANLLDLAVDAIVSIDKDQQIVGFNRGAQSVFGYLAEEVVGKPLTMLLPEKSRAIHTKHVSSFGAADQSARLMGERREIFGRRRDGTEFPAEASILKHHVDGVMQLTAILRDVTEQRRAEEELRRTARQQAAVARLAQAAVTGSTPIELMTELAATTSEVLGVERTAVLELDKGELVVRATRGMSEHEMPMPMPIPAGELAKFSGSGEVQLCREIRVFSRVSLAPGQTEVWAAIPGPKQPLGIVAVCCAPGKKLSLEDTRFLQAKTSILAAAISRIRAEDRMRAYIEGAPDATIIVNIDGKIVSANEQVEVLFGYSRDEICGMNVDELVPYSARADHANRRDSFNEHPRKRVMGAGLNLFGRRKDGSEVPVDIMLNPLLTDEGQVVVAAVRDVTERRRVEAIRDAFLHAVSHELRTPLTSVIGFAGLLRQPGALDGADSSVEEMVDQIYGSARRLEQLLSDLLDLDRLSRGVMEPSRHPTDLEELSRAVLNNVHLADTSITIDMEPQARIANVDSAQVERIVENLLVNISRHCPPQTPIWIRATRGPNGVLLSVEDAGPGVPEHLRETLFEPFRRGDPTGAVKGTGIGLSLVARFAELHGGRAWIEEREGGGAAFRVLLGDAA